MRRFVRDNGLSLLFVAIFLAALAAQAVSGLADVNRDQVSAGLGPLSLQQYVTSSAFGVDVMENWQSEFLQFLLFITATVWLLQRGSPESKDLGDSGRGTDEEQQVGAYATAGSPAWARARSWRLSLYSHSLSLVMGGIFVASWLVQSLCGAVAYSEQQMRELADPVPWTEYLRLPEFWNRTFQNWQSEFLAVASMVVLSVYLRERGSPESKPVGAEHAETGVAG